MPIGAPSLILQFASPFKISSKFWFTKSLSDFERRDSEAISKKRKRFAESEARSDDAGSSNGRTVAFGAINSGSNPGPAAYDLQ